MGVLCGLVLLRGLLFAGFSIKAASVMHDKAAARLLRAPMTFLDTTPIGQILNRFSQV
jgi:ABC-type bacteriocin/lantibiotic exporter with double-glycine peptidase domain